MISTGYRVKRKYTTSCTMASSLSNTKVRNLYQTDLMLSRFTLNEVVIDTTN